MPKSLQLRLALSLGILLTALWIAAASVTAFTLRHEMDEVFDSALQETAQRLLPLAVMDIIDREEDGITQRLAAIREHDELFTYVVRDDQGRILVQSHAANPADFPAYDGSGFRQTSTHRLYNDDALQGSVRITVAEPLEHRSSVARSIQFVLGLPLLIVIPVALLGVVLLVRGSLSPLRRYRARLQARTARDLSPVSAAGLPSEITPIAASLNDLLARLKSTFEAERNFASNAAHELRTPLAGAIAQAQRLRTETGDPAAAVRAADIEATLKRLTRLSERLMQLARAEGGRLRLDRSCDLRDVLRIVIDDMARASDVQPIALECPDAPVMSDLDPDAFAILCRNLVENAMRHGAKDRPITVELACDGILTVSNEGLVVPPEVLSRLTRRFERAGGGDGGSGSGLGLAIVAAITDRIGGDLVLASPRPGAETGFNASVHVPLSS